MNRQSLFMLIGAAVLGLVAVFVARAAFGAKNAPTAATIAVVAAAKPLSFGDKITADTLKLVELPVAIIPQGAFRRVDAAVGDGARVAQRTLAINEIVIPTAISGTGNRLSTMGVIGGSMRALTVNVTESSGVGGLVAPGDHVDVYITRTPPDKAPRYDVVAPASDVSSSASTVTGAATAGTRPGAFGASRAGAAGPILVRSSAPEGDRATPITDLLIQDVRVLAIGQNINVSSEKPELVKSATLEVTPAQVAKLTLGQNVGTLALALRPLSDTGHTSVSSLHVEDLHDGPVHVATAAPVIHHARVRRVVTHAAPAAPAEPQVDVVRGGEATHYTVPS